MTDTAVRIRRDPAPPPSQQGERLDIQGLRAVAVLSVFANHLWDRPGGGFVGVDIFFVISGFLITGLLLREHERTGRISIGGFYRRRARRIIPAAVIVIVTTVAATYYLFNSSRGDVVRTDGVWAMLFASNWHFAVQGTDYWQTDGVISPLQHFWSLAVEEQFYVVWPLLIIAVSALSKRRRSLSVVLSTIVVASFAYSLWHTSQAPTWAYFSTFDRAWELGLGAVLALGAARLAALPRSLGHVLGWIGLAGIVLSILIVPQEHFPAPWAALPVISTALVIAAGCGGSQWTLFPLVNPAARYIGDISYSLYLWHFPVIISCLALYPDRGATFGFLTIGLTAGLSMASYHLVEDPIRRSSWLLPRARKNSRQPATGSVRRSDAGLVALGILALSISAVVVIDRPGELDTMQRSDMPALDTAVSDEAPQTERDRMIDEALASTSFPDFDIPLADLGIANWRDDLVEAVGCYDAGPENVSSCSTGPADAQNTAAVVGDSFAMAYMPGILKALEPGGYRTQQLTLGQCPAWDTDIQSLDGVFTECREHLDWTVDWLSENPVDVVFITDASPSIIRLASGAEGDDAIEEASQALADYVARVKPYVGRVVILPGPPGSVALQECVTNVGGPQDCTRSVNDNYLDTRSAEMAGAELSGSLYVDNVSWFCSADGLCPGWVGETPVRVDNGHLTIRYSEGLSPEIAAAAQLAP